MITISDIQVLQQEARVAGDYVQDTICALAIFSGPGSTAWRSCEEAITNGRG